MADNFLERQRRDYEERKQQWQKSNTKKSVSVAAILRKSRERFNNDLAHSLIYSKGGCPRPKVLSIRLCYIYAYAIQTSKPHHRLHVNLFLATMT